MSEEHREQADAVERELDDMEEQADNLHEEIEATRADWERKKEDDSVPGAVGKTQIRQEGPPPEAGNQ
jgi:t-SNARE complex subunit (syntaxin)